ncbi:MAG TPA: VWA domain-containing protein [Bryobacteraceae bacterium]|jgi:Ca-activated chloride channel family protein
MKLTRLGCVLLTAACLAQVQFRSDVHLINVAFSVRDAQGKLVTDLHEADFEMVEDGVPQKIAFFARSQDVPLNLGLIMDVSGSQGSFVKPHLKDLELFLQNVLGQEDRAFLLCFGNRLRMVSDFSSSATELTEALRDFHNIGERRALNWNRKRKKKESEPLPPPVPELGPAEIRTAGTAFYDAIYYAIGEKLAGSDKPGGQDHGRRALVIFSDGEDNSSAHHMMEAIESAQANDVLLFCIRYTEVRGGRLTARNKYGTSVMERIARETGGVDFDAREKGLAEGFKQIGEQLRSSYELGYHSSNPVSDDSFHKIAIRMKDHPGMTVRAKTGYYARQ